MASGGGAPPSIMQARKVSLLPHSHSQPPQPISSLLYDPTTHSLALMLADSSFLLYPSLSSSPNPIPISSTACFLPNPIPIFFTAAPAAPSSTLLRAWDRRASAFSPVNLAFNRLPPTLALTLPLPHGIGVRMAATVNYLVLHSLAANQIWVMSVVNKGDAVVSLMKCAVINCCLPIYEVKLLAGFLLLGEVGGVRVFPLRELVKGKRETGAGKLANGVVGRRGKGGAGGRVLRCNGETVGKDAVEKNPGRRRTTKLWQNSGEHGSVFIEMGNEVQNSENSVGALTLVKAVSIHELSVKTFLILDSLGDVYLLSLQNTVKAPEASRHSVINSKYAHICRLTYTMKVQMLAVLPDISNKTPVIWISDGAYSVHVVSVADIESSVNEIGKARSGEKAMQISAIQAILMSDKIQDVVPLSANGVLILCKGSMFSYAIA